MIKVSSGVTGLDEMLNGGFPSNKIILFRGGPGTGKTISCIQFILDGAKKEEKGIYVTLEEPLDSIRETTKNLGFEIENFEKNNKIKLIDGSQMVYRFSQEPKKQFGNQKPEIATILNQIKLEAENFGAKRLAIDPLTSAIIHQRFPTDKRLEILEFFKTLRKINCTSIITSESASASEDEFFVEEYLADGVIILSQTLNKFTLTKTVRIEKMRGTKHDDQPRKYEFTENGIIIYNTEPVIT